jgi:glycosyltransferase involved in cell wall biosynthesis
LRFVRIGVIFLVLLFELKNMNRLGSKNPLVSMALPVYNGQAFLAEAISSCLAQDYDNFELIITDNASTDSTERICREFGALDGRVKYIRNERNLGAGPNFNLGVKCSSGKYMKWCASDDRISPNFISACVSVLEKNPDVVLAYGKTVTIDAQSRIIPLVGRGMTEQQVTDSVARRFHKDLYDRASNFEIFGVFRKSALEKSTLQRPYYGADVTLVNELTLLGRFSFVPDAIFYNREHPDRSINIRDKNVLLAWQDTALGARRKPRRENTERFRHLIEIAFRHRHRIPFFKIMGVIFIWTVRKTVDRLTLTFHQTKMLLASKTKLNGNLRRS